jgi:hypothetical protein
MHLKAFMSILLFFAMPINCSEKDKKADAEKSAKGVGALVAQAAAPVPALAAAQMNDDSSVALQASYAEILETLKAIHAIKQIALSVAQKVKDEDGTALSLREMPVPNPYRRTTMGLLLKCDNYPASLITPWGEIEFYGNASYKGKKISNVFEHFKKQMALQFIENSGETGFKLLNPQDRAVMQFYKDGKEIAEKDLAECRGTNAQITASLCGYESSYNITAVNGVQVKQVKIFQKSEGRERSEAIQKNWAGTLGYLIALYKKV